MSVPLGVAARAPRQSGLKKPRPLRSVSLQEGKREGTDCDVNAIFQRQISAGVLGENNIEDERQPVMMCKEIASMSARLANDTAYEENDRLCEKPYKSTRPYSSSEISHTNTFKKSPSPLSDYNYNNTTLSSRNEFSYDQYHRDGPSSASSNSSRRSSNDDSDFNKVQTGVSDNSHLCPSLNQDMSPPSSSSGSAQQTICVATLSMEKGETIVLTGRNMRTILSASRVLLREMKAKIIKIEEISDQDAGMVVPDEQKSSGLQRPTPETPETTPLPEEPSCGLLSDASAQPKCQSKHSLKNSPGKSSSLNIHLQKRQWETKDDKAKFIDPAVLAGVQTLRSII